MHGHNTLSYQDCVFICLSINVLLFTLVNRWSVWSEAALVFHGIGLEWFTPTEGRVHPSSRVWGGHQLFRQWGHSHLLLNLPMIAISLSLTIISCSLCFSAVRALSAHQLLWWGRHQRRWASRDKTVLFLLAALQQGQSDTWLHPYFFLSNTLECVNRHINTHPFYLSFFYLIFHGPSRSHCILSFLLGESRPSFHSFYFSLYSHKH